MDFPPHIIDTLRNTIKKRHLNSKETERENKKWSTFTYYSPAVRTITNIFKHTNLRIAYKTTNTIKQQTTNHRNNNSPNHNKSSIYKLTCRTCNKAYIGQNSKTIATRYKEHTRYIKNNHPQSAYALHILQNRHEYGSFDDNMTLVKPINKTHKLIPYERMVIQQVYGKGNLIPEQACHEHDPLYKLAKIVNNT